MESCEIGEIDTDACLELDKQILTDEFDDPEFLAFTIENHSELFGYIVQGNLNIRDIEGLPPSERHGRAGDEQFGG